jgi:SPP1 family predicted phage head-tail adaptor
MLATKLDRMRARVNASLSDSCVIPREAPGVVNPDGSTEPGVVTDIDYDCAVGPLGNSPQERLIAARLESETGFVVTLPFDADVRETDTIEWNGQTLQVIGVIGPRTYQINLRVATKRIS